MPAHPAVGRESPAKHTIAERARDVHMLDPVQLGPVARQLSWRGRVPVWGHGNERGEPRPIAYPGHVTR
jgi:hypothetical protein